MKLFQMRWMQLGIGEFIPDNIETKTDNNSESENIMII